MTLMFKKHHLKMVIAGKKTMTRRVHKRPLKAGRVYQLRRDWYHSIPVWIEMLKVYTERLGDISEEDARKEGGYTVEEFKDVWRDITKAWTPEMDVTVYEFEVVEPEEPVRGETVKVPSRTPAPN